jgi:hypothetical protein
MAKLFLSENKFIKVGNNGNASVKIVINQLMEPEDWEVVVPDPWDNPNQSNKYDANVLIDGKVAFTISLPKLHKLVRDLNEAYSIARDNAR